MAGALGAAFWLFGGMFWPHTAPAPQTTAQPAGTFVVKNPEPAQNENLFAPVTEVLGAVAPAVKKFVAAAPVWEESAGEVLGASVTKPQKKYVTRGSRADDPLPPAPVLAVAGCAASPCSLTATTVNLSWSQTNGAFNYQVLVNGLEAETTQNLVATVLLADLATSTVQVVAVHGASGNGAGFVSNTVEIYVETLDTVAPVFDPYADVLATTASTTATTTAVTYTLPTATDDRDGAVAVSCDPASGSTFATGTTQVLCSAQDLAGNSATTTFGVVVSVPVDTTAPVISNMPADMSVEATSTNATYATVSYTLPTADDETDGVVAVECTPASGSDFSLGTTTVLCTAEDVAGNSAQETFDIGVYLPVVATDSLLEDSFDDGITGWQIFGINSKLFDHSTSSVCFAGGCAQGGGFSFGVPRMYKQGDELVAGAFTIYARQQNVSGAEPQGFVSLCIPGSNCVDGSRIDFQGFFYDGVWRQYLMAWRQGATAVESCKLVRNPNTDPELDINNCSWDATAHALGTSFDVIALFSASGYNASSNNDLWFDELAEYEL